MVSLLESLDKKLIGRLRHYLKERLKGVDRGSENSE
jgi:hypothetical protein